MWVVFCGTEDVAQFDTRVEAEDHARNLNEGYRSSQYRVEYVPDYWNIWG